MFSSFGFSSAASAASSPPQPAQPAPAASNRTGHNNHNHRGRSSRMLSLQPRPPAPGLRAEEEVLDFFTDTSYVNVHETDADEVDILLAGGDPGTSSSSPWHNHPYQGPQHHHQWLYESNETHHHHDKVSYRTARLDALALLLSSPSPSATSSSSTKVEQLVSLLEQATRQMNRAAHCQQQQATRTSSDPQVLLTEAVQAHEASAQLFYQAACLLEEPQSSHQPPHDGPSSHSSLARSFLLLSQFQARSALGLAKVLQPPGGGPPLTRPRSTPPPTTASTATVGSTPSSSSTRPSSSSSSHASPSAAQDRIRETVRGVWNSAPPEADLSESVFLGKPKQAPTTTTTAPEHPTATTTTTTTAAPNPIDEMMNLERELRDMDMALELGNSLASLDTTTTTTVGKHHAGRHPKTLDGSFMVVPPASSSANLSNSLSASFLSTSMMMNPGPTTTNTPSNNPRTLQPTTSGTASVRARANRVQTLSSKAPTPTTMTPTTTTASVPVQSTARSTSTGLESSWWGNSSTMSILSTQNNSHPSASSRTTTTSASLNGPAVASEKTSHSNKQLLRLMDSLKRLGDENAALLREVEDAEAARAEAKAAKVEMRRFKQEYQKRFETLKDMLQRFRKGFGGMSRTAESPGSSNPPTTPNTNTNAAPPTTATSVGSSLLPNWVANSQYLLAASTSEQLQRQEHLIRKLTMDLKKEKDEAKKKDVIFRRYESFYRDVKAMSAQKAAQRKQQQQQQQQQKGSASPPTKGVSSTGTPRRAPPTPPSQSMQRPLQSSSGSSRRSDPSTTTVHRVTSKSTK